MLSTSGAQREDRWLRRLFFALAFLYVLPFWAVHHLPTTDGPSHTYNAWIIRQYANTAQYPLFQRHYEVVWKPYPNWTSHATMALLMFVVPPLLAEKLLVSGYVLLFLGGAWYLVGAVRPEERWLAFLAFPFAYHQLFQYGFYNFSISVGLFLFVLGFWWRHRERPGLAFAVKINLLLWLCYFSHILSCVLALAAIGVLWLATLRRADWRRHLLHIPILLPQIVLPLWYVFSQGGGAVPSDLPFERLRSYLFDLKVLATFSEIQARWVAELVYLFLLLLLATLIHKGRRRPVLEAADAFLVLALAGVALFFLSPGNMSGGGLLKQRLSLYPYLLLIPWFSPGLVGKAKSIGAAVLALLALLNLGALLYWYRVRSAEMESYLSGLAAVPPNTRILGLNYRHTWPTDSLSHAMGYKALEAGLIDWDNYEAKTNYFPTRFRSSVVVPKLRRVVRAPDSFQVEPNRDLIDVVYTWQMPPPAPLRRRLRNSYKPIAKSSGGELWLRRGAGIESAHGGTVETRE